MQDGRAAPADEETRVYIIVRTDLELGRLALAAAASRAVWAVLSLASRDCPDRLLVYDEAMQPKIGKRSRTEGHLRRALAESLAAGLPAALVHGLDGQAEAVAVGPVRRSELPVFVEKLQLLPDGEPEGAAEEPAAEEQDPGEAVWLFVRDDAQIPYGKLAAQAGHGLWGAVGAILRSGTGELDEWNRTGARVHVHAIPDLDAMELVYRAAVECGLGASFIVDAGRTVFNGPTPTVAAVGPCLREHLPEAVLPFLQAGPARPSPGA